jgi:hypothetical protein
MIDVYETIIEDVRSQCGLETRDEAIEYILLHYKAFEKEFIQYVEGQ